MLSACLSCPLYWDAGSHTLDRCPLSWPAGGTRRWGVGGAWDEGIYSSGIIFAGILGLCATYGYSFQKVLLPSLNLQSHRQKHGLLNVPGVYCESPPDFPNSAHIHVTLPFINPSSLVYLAEISTYPPHPTPLLERVSCISGWPQIHFVDKDDFKLLALLNARMQTHTTTCNLYDAGLHTQEASTLSTTSSDPAPFTSSQRHNFR